MRKSDLSVCMHVCHVHGGALQGQQRVLDPQKRS